MSPVCAGQIGMSFPVEPPKKVQDSLRFSLNVSVSCDFFSPQLLDDHVFDRKKGYFFKSVSVIIVLISEIDSVLTGPLSGTSD